MPKDGYWTSPQLFWDVLKATFSPLNFLITPPGRIVDDVTEKLLIKQHKEQEENKDIKPEKDDPPQVIFPPPVNIFDIDVKNTYNKTTININIKLPKRVLPDKPTPPPTGGGGGGSSNTEVDIQSVVWQSLANRKYGCMLSKPYYGKEINWCDYEEPNEFYTTIQTKMNEDITLAQQKLDDPDEPTDFLSSLMSLAFLSINSYSHPIPIVGLNQINKISEYYSARAEGVSVLPVTGMFTNKGIKKTPCKLDDRTITLDNLPIKYSVGDDDCSVPITFFSDIDGYKRDQLQLIFQSVDDKRRKRSITMPSVGDIDTIDPTTAGINTLPFGGTLIEIWHDLKNVEGHVQPVQKSKFYSNYSTKEEIETFVYTTYKKWLGLLCKDVEIKAYQVIIQDETKEEKYHKGDYKPYRAVYMGWDQEKLKWCNKKAWYL